jgi:predicted AAA+ superfamily ATPase
MGERRIDRRLIVEIEAGLARDRCALLVGPYEVGKSDLARDIARRFGAGAHIFNASLDADRRAMRRDDGILRNSVSRLVVIDEIHAFPECLDLIRAALDAPDRHARPLGQFLLLGSDVRRTRTLVADRLGTYAPVYTLAPIALDELPDPTLTVAPPIDAVEIMATSAIALPNDGIELDTLWLRGGLPRSLLAETDAAAFAYREKYLSALAHRDYSHINPALSGTSIRELLQRLAINQGEPFTIDKSRMDQKRLLDHLEDLGLVRQLRPLFPNRLKRFEKSGKVYLRDSGLLHALLKRQTSAQIVADATILGHSWEGFCIENIVAVAGGSEAFFYRTEDGSEEIDLVLEFADDRRLAIEFKAGSSKVGQGFTDAIRSVQAHETFVVRPMPERYEREGYREMTLPDMMAFVREFGR